MSRVISGQCARVPAATRYVAPGRRAAKPPRCSAGEDVVKLEPRQPMRVFIEKAGAKPDEVQVRYVADPSAYTFESIEMSRERRRWLTQTPFLTTQLGGEHDVKVVLFVADAPTRADNLCNEARKLLGGIDFELVDVYAEELYFVVRRLDADVMLVSPTDARLARLSSSGDT